MVYPNRKLERIVLVNIVFMYVAGFETPVFSPFASFKRKHQDVKIKMKKGNCYGISTLSVVFK